MASFWQDPTGWLSRERDRAAVAAYAPNDAAKVEAFQTPSGQYDVSNAKAPGGFWGMINTGPNPYEAAVDKTIAANRADVNGPFGNTDWTHNADGSWSMSQGFNGQLGGAANSLQQQMAQAYGSPMMTGDAARQQAIDSAYGQATSRLDPQWNQREDQMRTRLMNQGLDPQSEAYANALGQFGRDRNDAYSSAMNGAIGQGTMAGQSVFNQNMAARNQPLQSLLSMQGLLPGQAGASGGNYLGAQQMQSAEQQRQAQEQAQALQAVVQGVTTAAAIA